MKESIENAKSIHNSTEKWYKTIKEKKDNGRRGRQSEWIYNLTIRGKTQTISWYKERNEFWEERIWKIRKKIGKEIQ